MVVIPGLGVIVLRSQGKWAAKCPRCKELVRAMTNAGMPEALCNHLNEQHYEPRRGNA